MEQHPTVYSMPTITKEAGPSSTKTAPRPTHPPPTITGASNDFGADWTFDGILAKGTHFKPVPRVSALDEEEMLKAIERHDNSGIPLIIEGWHLHPRWKSELLDIEWLLQNKGDEGVQAPIPPLLYLLTPHPVWHVRNMQDRTDVDMTLSEFVARSRAGERTADNSMSCMSVSHCRVLTYRTNSYILRQGRRLPQGMVRLDKVWSSTRFAQPSWFERFIQESGDRGQKIRPAFRMTTDVQL